MSNQIKLIVSDLDGTIVTKKYVLAPGIKDAVSAARARGVHFALCTGRMFGAAQKYADELGLDEPIISYNGAMVQRRNGDVIGANYLGSELVKSLLDFIDEHEWYVQLYEDDVLYYAKKGKVTDEYERANHLRGVEVGDDGMRSHAERVPKLLVVRNSEAEADATLEMLRETFAGKIAVVKSTPTFVEVVPPEVNKGEGLRVLANEYGIDMSETMAMGDAGNDVSMIKAAGVGVAMGNATDEAKAAADYVTTNVDEGGAADAIRQFVLEKDDK